LFTLSMTISFSCYDYNNYKKVRYHLFNSVLINVDITLSKG
jgi:hypothetical protein